MTPGLDRARFTHMAKLRPLQAALGTALGALVLLPTPAEAVTSSRSVPSSFGANGHNISFDGRVILARDGSGWVARLVRPEGVTFLEDGLPDATGPLVSGATLIYGHPEVLENALAICEQDAARAPYACDAAGAEGGPFACYDFQILDSDAVTPPEEGGFILRRRSLRLWVRDPLTPSAEVDHWEIGEPTPLAPTLMGIEPTVTRDGKLLVWQGHPDNDGEIDILVYSVAAEACAASGWSTPRSISGMFEDPAVIGVYPLAERRLRAADGTPFEASHLFRGAYPWLMPDGDAIIFAAAPMPCRATEDPPGCGPRRNALSVVGYPTNWGVAHIDGGVNPDTDQTVRLFFSSPGPTTFEQLPVTPGADVWPFFGSNTSNYVELIFDDGLDGQYAGLWHLNESVTHEGELDVTRTPDVSGYFNTGVLHGGLGFSTTNDGVIGKALTFDGVDDRVEVASTQSLSPVNGITIDFQIRPTGEPDCDDQNNYRLLLSKGDTATGSYTVVLEEGRVLQARVNVDGVQQAIVTPPLALDAWTSVSIEYDGPSGQAGVWFDDVQVTTTSVSPGTLVATDAPLLIGGPGARAACPPGDGAFAGQLDEVAVSRFARRLGEPEPTTSVGVGAGGGATTSATGSGPSGSSGSESGTTGNGAGGGPSGGNGNGGSATPAGSGGAGDGVEGGGTDEGCGCETAGAPARRGGAVAIGLVVTAALARRRRRGA
jgi:MYXO-CTERM domain-containing protein